MPDYPAGGKREQVETEALEDEKPYWRSFEERPRGGEPR